MTRIVELSTGKDLTKDLENLNAEEKLEYVKSHGLDVSSIREVVSKDL
jgi:ribulose bisphosphate carboxylase small subunit